MKNRTNVQDLLVDTAVNAYTAKVTFTPEAGTIERVMVSWGANPDNAGFVRASLKDSSGDYIVQLQSIHNIRSREVQYEKDGIPVNFQGMKPVTFEVIGTEVFNTNFPCEINLIYKQEQDKQPYC